MLTPKTLLYILLQRDLPGRLHEVKAKENQAQAHRRRFIPAGRQRRARNKWKSLQQSSAMSLPNYATSLPSLSSGLPQVSDLRVAPLVQSKWDQGSESSAYCYNYYTNFNLSTGFHYLTGCIATAMAQVMRYHQFPQLGAGTPQFTIRVDYLPRTAFLLGGDGNGGALCLEQHGVGPERHSRVTWSGKP